ncbi:MAG TPA: sigma-70 family RNA polymerase sigma factor [Candidatus Baltobacteraceae bacterium]|nr:sigma-70 family RNA polymerase sigma factor [Candidatus Baltobacteraceae bacterium]
MNAQEREEAIRELFPLVKRLARRLHRLIPGTDRDDLVGDGCIGAVKAVDHFQPERNVPLKHYAARVIAGAMLNGLRAKDTVPERVRRELRLADHERYSLAAQIGTFPTHAEMEERRPKLRRARSIASRYTPLSLDTALPLGERLECDWSEDPGRIAAANSQREELQCAIDALPPRQRDVLARHYVHGHSFSAIGKTLNISPQRASQLHLAAMKRLRTMLVHAAS